MKYALLSDVHAHLPALDAVLGEFAECLRHGGDVAGARITHGETDTARTQRTKHGPLGCQRGATGSQEVAFAACLL